MVNLQQFENCASSKIKLHKIDLVDFEQEQLSGVKVHFIYKVHSEKNGKTVKRNKAIFTRFLANASKDEMNICLSKIVSTEKLNMPPPVKKSKTLRKKLATRIDSLKSVETAVSYKDLEKENHSDCELMDDKEDEEEELLAQVPDKHKLHLDLQQPVMSLQEMFLAEPQKVSDAALQKWKELPKLQIESIKTDGVVTQRFDQEDKWTGKYDYFGLVSLPGLYTESLENGIGRKCWHQGGIEEG